MISFLPGIILLALLSSQTVGAFCPSRSRGRKEQVLWANADLDGQQQLLEQQTTRALQTALDKVDRLTTTSPDPILAPFFDQCAQNCEKAPSSIADAGTGLFAANTIKKGSIISWYPVHCLGLDLEDTLRVASDKDTYFEEDNPEYIPDYLLNVIGSRPLPFLPPFVASSSLFLDVNPTRDDCPGWLSHYINDGATVQTNTEAGILQYYLDTAETRNCVHVPFGPCPLMATVATQDISKGQELFTSYGGIYWLEQLLLEDDEEFADITDEIQEAAKASAMVLLQAMKGIQEKSVANALQKSFDRQGKSKKPKKPSKGFGN